jgi:hypothetical protein
VHLHCWQQMQSLLRAACAQLCSSCCCQAQCDSCLQLRLSCIDQLQESVRPDMLLPTIQMQQTASR